MKPIICQIKAKPNAHACYFSCLAIGCIGLFVDGFSSEPFIAGLFVIDAIIGEPDE